MRKSNSQGPFKFSNYHQHIPQDMYHFFFFLNKLSCKWERKITVLQKLNAYERSCTSQVTYYYLEDIVNLYCKTLKEGVAGDTL